MNGVVHFAKVFAIAWAVITGLWAAAFFRGADFSVGWSGQRPPPMWVFQLLLWAWPVIPAFAIAAIWELARLVMFRRH